MENNFGIKVFENEQFGQVRVVERESEPWFVAADVCRALDISDVSSAVARLDQDERSTTVLTRSTSGGNPNVTIVNEPGLYSLVLGSRKPEAKVFKRWITHEVIPSIRKNGGYIANQETLTPAEIVANALIVAQNIINDQKRKLAEQEPFVAFANHVGDSSDLIDMGRMAKLAQDEHIDLGRNKLFAWLRENGYLMANNMPYQRYIDQGIFDVKESYKETAYGTKLFQTTYVTGKGQIYLIEKLRDAFCALV